MVSPDTVRKVRQALKTQADYLFFFQNLKSAEWVKPLADDGFFSEPPHGVEAENGLMRFPRWPESEYLARIANEAPELTIKTAVRIPSTENPNVHRDLIEVALKVPTNIAASTV